MASNCVFCGKSLGMLSVSYRAGNTGLSYCDVCVKYFRAIQSALEVDPNHYPTKTVNSIRAELQSPNSNQLKAINAIILTIRPELSIASAEEQKKAQELAAREKAARIKLYKDFIFATTPTLEGRQIVDYLGVLDAEVVMGTGFLSEFSASIDDFFGVSSTSMGNKLSSAKSAALEKLKEKCISIGANACVGVDFDIMTLGNNMIVASASGTAVKIVPDGGWR